MNIESEMRSMFSEFTAKLSDADKAILDAAVVRGVGHARRADEALNKHRLQEYEQHLRLVETDQGTIKDTLYALGLERGNDMYDRFWGLVVRAVIAGLAKL